MCGTQYNSFGLPYSQRIRGWRLEKTGEVTWTDPCGFHSAVRHLNQRKGNHGQKEVYRIKVPAH